MYNNIYYIINILYNKLNLQTEKIDQAFGKIIIYHVTIFIDKTFNI